MIDKASVARVTCEGIDPSSAQPFGAQLKLMRRISLKNGQPYTPISTGRNFATFRDKVSRQGKRIKNALQTVG
jgi:hypothetical protein